MKKIGFILFFLCLRFMVGAQCSNFKIVANKSSICAPDIVTFQVVNAVAGSSYQWNVGQGLTSGADTIFAFYTSATTVNATVAITLPSGTVCNISQDSILVVRDKPEPQFTASSFLLCHGPGQVQFTDLTPNSEFRNWVIDGSNYNLTKDSVVHSFVTTGLKTVSLVVIDSFGCQGVAQFIDTIEVLPELKFDFKANVKSGCIPKDIIFSITKDPSTPFNKSYQWSFPNSNQNSGSGVGPHTRTYSSSGSNDVTLTVKLNNGCTYVKEKRNFIKLGDTVDLDIRLQNTIGCDKEPVIALLKNNNLPGTITWQYSGINITETDLSDYEKSLNVIDTGALTVEVTHNHNGCVSSASITRMVDRDSVIADFFSPDHYHCAVPHTVHLFNSSKKGSASSLSYQWNITQGDSLYYSSTNEDDSFTFYDFLNTYGVELIIVGDNGCTDTMVRPGFIYQDTMKLKFNPIPDVGCIGQSIFFRNDTRPTSYLSPDEFEWTFYDLDDSSILDTSTLRDPTMVYYDTGYYDVLLIGQNGIGCKDTLLKEDAVYIVDPQLNYNIEDPSFCKGDSTRLVSLSGPSTVAFTDHWILVHEDTVYQYLGDSVFVKPSLPGYYDLIYSFDISGGCVRSDTTFIVVNDLQGELPIDTLVGCSPFKVYPELLVSRNNHYPSQDSSLIYSWFTNSIGQHSIDDTAKSNPLFTLIDEGIYQIGVVAENSVGCIDTVYSDTLEVGLNADFSAADPIICKGDTFKLSFTSRDTTLDLSWSVKDYSDYEVFKYSYFDYGLYIPDSGTHTISLSVSQPGSCSDTSALEVEVIQVIADFNSNDTFLQCAPVYVQFESLSVNADSLIWDFGAGETNITTSKSAGTIYSKNTGVEDGYDILLIAKNNHGCVDSSLKLDYVVVRGPRPYFEMDNYIGCEPLKVSFKDSSHDVARFFLNYNDGSELDSSSIESHTYYNTSSDLVQKIYPSLFVFDSLGCGALYEPPEPVTIYRKPDAGFIMQVDSGCKPIKVVYTDTGQFRLSSLWLINGDSISSKIMDSISIGVSGPNEISLITSNTVQCSDTASKSVFVNGLPLLDFEILDTICLYRSIRFKSKITADGFTDTANIKNVWEFGETGTLGNKQFNLDSTEFTYQFDGPKRVKFNIVLGDGCTDSIHKDIWVRGQDRIEVPDLKFVSFNSNTELEVQHYPSTDYRFQQYTYTRSDGQILYNALRNDTVSLDLFSNTPSNVLCYDVNVNDICDLNGIASSEHCFVLLSATSIRPYEIDLSWNHYVGWSNILRYDVYRKAEGENNFSLIGQTAGDVNTYIDVGLCNMNYEYYVVARHPNQRFYSRSTQIVERPIYPINNVPSNIKNVSVSGENEITVKWNKSTNNRWSYFLLNKYESNLGQLVDSFQFTDTFLIDDQVETSKLSYIYTLREADICDELNMPDREGKSILLKAEYTNASYLDWTFYRRWLNGVNSYTVQLLHQGELSNLGQTGAGTNTFIDAEYHEDVFGPYCYRVYALNLTGDTSYSNIVCVVGNPNAFIPNAFTPNKDGLNEVFRPITSFMQADEVNGLESYRFSIYSRWGEKLFETYDIRESWDGTYKGENCQQGVYIYYLEALGVNDIKYSFKGNVTLLR
ncbi:MAG: gliding motility-associated C-terminal domain-containing protein [Bacteroidia bacterium]